MSTGGIFTLITNDGKQDRMLMATELLNKRLMAIRKAREADPNIADPTPTLVDVERTHVLFMNAHFKPFAAIGYEYNKVNPQSGNAVLSSTNTSSISFSIPQFGDFFNDMVLYVRLEGAAVTGEAALVPNGPTVAVLAASAQAEKTQLRYCDYIGERLLSKVSFQVNGNPLDEYTSDVYNMHRQFCVQPNKQTGWNRNVGQEEVLYGYSNGNGSTGAAASQRIQDFRQHCAVSVGAQTPKQEQGAVDLFVPLLFWFNKDPRLAIPSVSIPYGQRFINIDLAPANQLLSLVDRGVTNVSTLTNPSITQCSLYINNIFVNPEVHDIYIKRIGFTLIRVHRRHEVQVNKGADEVLLTNLKWPIEDLFFGMRPSDNRANATQAQREASMSNWHRFGRIVESAYIDPNLDALQNNAALLAGNIDNPAAAYRLNRCVVKQCTAVLDRVTIQAHGIPIYNDFPAQFYNSYIPYAYGGANIRTPEDCGLHMATFNLYPGSYQPSGHINISRAREFFFKYTASVIPATVATADLVVVASAINFLLISDGSAVLRYST